MYYKKRKSHGNFSRFKKSKKQAPGLDVSLLVKKAKLSKTAEQKSTTLFTEFPLAEKLQRNIRDYGFTTTTPIQEKTIPHLLKGKDVIGIANTGTGKTAAFLVPLINKALIDRNERCLIVTPTRELALQIADELTPLVVGMELEKALCIGGSSLERQIKRLRHNPHFVIGTPGRLIDLVKRNKLPLHLYRNVVLDEVDRMVDIGFLKDIQFLVSYLPKKRQSLFFSATITEKEKTILKSFVSDPITVSVKQQDTSENVDQDIIRIKNKNAKVDILHELLIQKEFEKVLVFGKTKWGIEKLTKTLIDRGFKATAIHGNKTQGQRQRALEQFRNDDVKVLLATDVASRGLDISNVTHVINYDIPATYEDYIHRIGRTGRAGKSGVALTFVE